jgi:hypothetical protein
MPREQFIEKKFAAASVELIERANEIITAYRLQGYILTLRQLYYQFVARDLIENTMRSYKRLGSVINDGRLAGLIDWEAIEDRTRNLEKNWTFKSPKAAIEQMRKQYRIDMWSNQEKRVEVWIEKEALVGVIEGVCRELDVPYFACRGYVSQSEQWRSGKRAQVNRRLRQQETVILHFGDHDPSGIDMTRDNDDRLRMFAGRRGAPTVERIALNMDQVEQYDPPPNPAKMTDSRFEGYLAEYGDKCWELDALEPKVIDQLIRDNVDQHRDMDLWIEREAQLDEEETILDDIIEGLDE